MKISTNYQWIGKPEKREVDEGLPTMWYAGKQVFIGFNWENVDLEREEIFDLVSTHGLPIGPEIGVDEKGRTGHKTKRTFISHQVAMVDIDDGMTIEQLMEDPFYCAFGGGFYVSPSHTEHHHKFRIIHFLESPVTDNEEMEYLYSALINEYGGDGNCRDGARYFNGTENATRKQLTDRTLPDAVVNSLIKEQRQIAEEKYKNSDVGVEYSPLDDEQKRKVLEVLKTIYVGDMTMGQDKGYAIWSRVGWALRSNGFTVDDFVYITLGGMMRKKSRAAAIQVWEEGRSYPISYGYIVNLLKYCGKWDQLKQTSKERKRQHFKDVYKTLGI